MGVVAVLVSESPRLASLDIWGKTLDPKLLCQQFEQYLTKNGRHHPSFAEKNLGRYSRGVANILMDSTRIRSPEDAKHIASLYKYLPSGSDLNLFQVDDDGRRNHQGIPSSCLIAFAEAWASMKIIL